MPQPAYGAAMHQRRTGDGTERGDGDDERRKQRSAGKRAPLSLDQEGRQPCHQCKPLDREQHEADAEEPGPRPGQPIEPSSTDPLPAKPPAASASATMSQRVRADDICARAYGVGRRVDRGCGTGLAPNRVGQNECLYGQIAQVFAAIHRSQSSLAGSPPVRSARTQLSSPGR